MIGLEYWVCVYIYVHIVVLFLFCSLFCFVWGVTLFSFKINARDLNDVEVHIFVHMFRA